MATPIRLPATGTGAAGLAVSCWLVDIGDLLEEGDRVVELLTDGMTFDVAAPVGGRLCRVDRPLESSVAAGDILGWIEPEPLTGDGGETDT